jgi:peptidoglycan-N-acetylglucosamine deacetylase
MQKLSMATCHRVHDGERNSGLREIRCSSWPFQIFGKRTELELQNLIDPRTSQDHWQEERRYARSGTTKIDRIVTTSWDSGSPHDLVVASMLAARKLGGTFYVPVKGHHKSCRMDLDSLHMLDEQKFEVGALGVAHQDLCSCDSKQLVLEIEQCKARLEDDLGKQVSMFAYPQGRTNRRVIACLKGAGYRGARTTALLGCGLRFDPFRLPISLRVYPYLRPDYFRTLAKTLDLRRAWMYAAKYHRASNWIELAKLIFDSVHRRGGIWHLYGHSRDIEELRLWEGLREVLDYVANRPGVLYVANGPLVNLRATKFAGVESYVARPAV